MNGDSQNEVHAGDRADSYRVGKEEAETFPHNPPEMIKY